MTIIYMKLVFIFIGISFTPCIALFFDNTDYEKEERERKDKKNRELDKLLEDIEAQAQEINNKFEESNKEINSGFNFNLNLPIPSFDKNTTESTTDLDVVVAKHIKSRKRKRIYIFMSENEFKSRFNQTNRYKLGVMKIMLIEKISVKRGYVCLIDICSETS